MNYKNIRDQGNLLETTTIFFMFFMLGFIPVLNILIGVILHPSTWNQTDYPMGITTIVLFALTFLDIGLYFYLSFKKEMAIQSSPSEVYFTNVILRLEQKQQNGYFSFVLPISNVYLFFAVWSKIKKESQTKREYQQNIKNLISYFSNTQWIIQKDNLISPIANYNQSLIVIDDKTKQVFYLDNSIKNNGTCLTNNEINNIVSYNKNWSQKMAVFFKHTPQNPITPWQSNLDYSFYSYDSSKISGYLKMVSDLVQNRFQLNKEEMMHWRIACERKINKNSDDCYQFDLHKRPLATPCKDKAINKMKMFLNNFESLKRKIELKQSRKTGSV